MSIVIAREGYDLADYIRNEQLSVIARSASDEAIPSDLRFLGIVSSSTAADSSQ
jgi:hypothetical protein